MIGTWLRPDRMAAITPRYACISLTGNNFGRESA